MSDNLFWTGFGISLFIICVIIYHYVTLNWNRIIPTLFIGGGVLIVVMVVGSLLYWINIPQSLTRLFLPNEARSVNMLETDTGISRVGDTISFGKHYWYILSLHDDNTALITTRGIIGQRAFHDSQRDISWEQSDIRRYLNEDFYNTFLAEERNRILTTNVIHPGFRNTTEDKIFLLNQRESSTLFVGENAGRQEANSWFRTPVRINRGAINDVVSSGTIRISGGRRFTNVLTHNIGVRPALRIDLQNFPLPSRPWINWNEETALVGDTISFGGKNWRILNLNSDNSALLISQSIAEIRSYHSVATRIAWRDSDLRSFLNDRFFYTFSEDDRRLILPTTLSNEDDGGNTIDNVFILSLAEVERYLPRPMLRTFNQASSWWLRSSAGSGVSTISANGQHNTRGATVTAAHGVRPVIRISVPVQFTGVAEIES